MSVIRVTSALGVLLLAGCGAPATPQASTTSTTSAVPVTSPAPTTQPQAAAATRTEEFVALRVGDCVTNLPPSDLSSVTVDIVDCASPHVAEVFARKGIQVNAAVADVADRECEGAFSSYAGQSLAQGRYSVTYLIDSNQDRTSNDPLPSTVICLVQPADGRPLTGSVRH